MVGFTGDSFTFLSTCRPLSVQFNCFSFPSFKIYFFDYVYDSFASMFVGALCVWLIPVEPRSRPWIPWDLLAISSHVSAEPGPSSRRALNR